MCGFLQNGGYITATKLSSGEYAIHSRGRLQADLLAELQRDLFK
jgi:hypothetical protein